MCRSAAIVAQLPWLDVDAEAEGVADEARAELDLLLDEAVLLVADVPLAADAFSLEVLVPAAALTAKTPARARVALTAAAATVVRARAAGWGRREPLPAERVGPAGRGFVWSMTISFGVIFNPEAES
ncbi:MAG: hypothetical protein R2761_15515 [Acidimicrobiales bacterium]